MPGWRPCRALARLPSPPGGSVRAPPGGVHPVTARECVGEVRDVLREALGIGRHGPGVLAPAVRDAGAPQFRLERLEVRDCRLVLCPAIAPGDQVKEHHTTELNVARVEPRRGPHLRGRRAARLARLALLVAGTARPVGRPLLRLDRLVLDCLGRWRRLAPLARDDSGSRRPFSTASRMTGIERGPALSRHHRPAAPLYPSRPSRVRRRAFYVAP